MNVRLTIVLSCALTLLALRGEGCTSVIVSAKANASGLPVMLKHRDTDCPDGKIIRVQGPLYAFIGLANVPEKAGEVWSGTNEAGFCIMNTASYNFKDDDVPSSMMDREGEVMYKALGICATTSDFERFLDTLARPMGVEANFGVIDAKGGAAYYEVNNHRWIKYDVNDPSVAPYGWRVVTNFCEAGRVEDRKGVDRWEKATAIMGEAFYGQSLPLIDHDFLFSKVSRSGAPILRDITTASIVFEGVADGEDPSHTVMWTISGRPDKAPAVPLLVGEGDMVPPFLASHNLSSGTFGEDRLCFEFTTLHSKWRDGNLSKRKFYRKYRNILQRFWEYYLDCVAQTKKNA